MDRVVKLESSSASRKAVVGMRKSSGNESVDERRVLRYRYLTVKNRISDQKEDMSKLDSDKFKLIINEVENLHRLVQKPREQVSDAETLLDITNTLVISVKAHSNDGVTPSDFVAGLLGEFGHGGDRSSADERGKSIRWKEIGLVVSHVFKMAPGCRTMLGPMSTEIKQRKAVVQRKRVRPTDSACPEQLDGNGKEETTDTDKNMATMFDILRKNKRVRLESLILNQNSFAQTVENLFALSFLVKDGRAEIEVDDKHHHFIAPRNAPGANAVSAKEVLYEHFVFRFDFRDWQLMMGSIGDGEELMPQRVNKVNKSQTVRMPTTPIRKLSRNRGQLLQHHHPLNTTNDDYEGISSRKVKRKL